MDVDTMVVSVTATKAAQARDAYREAIRKDVATDADKLLYAAYRAIAQGKAILDIGDVMRKAGVFPQTNLPKLAVCRADVAWCWFIRRNGAYWFTSRQEYGARRPWATVEVPDETFPSSTRQAYASRARVPFIPPQYRPKHDLRNYHILWEAEWQRAMPVDPLLLKHIGGPFFTVLACWDLTPLEQAVMRGL